MKEKDLINRLNSNVNKTERKYSFTKGTKVSIPVNVKRNEKQCNKDCDKKECTCNNEKKARTFDDLVNEKSKKLCSLDGSKIYDTDKRIDYQITNEKLNNFFNKDDKYKKIPEIIKKCNEIYDKYNTDDNDIYLKFNEKELEDMVRKYVEKYINEEKDNEDEIELEAKHDEVLSREDVKDIVRDEIIKICNKISRQLSFDKKYIWKPVFDDNEINKYF